MKKYIIILAILLLPLLFINQGTEAGAEHNVTGWAWAENVGWISMNSENHAGGVNYGVHIGEDGNFTGYAWNNYDDGGIGWIDFDPSGPYPEAPNYSVKLDLATGGITGWARALSYGDGWDGWIKMHDTTLVTGEIMGYAWGDEVLGWISFSCENESECGSSDYQVATTFAPKPTIDNPERDEDYDIQLRKTGAIYFSWIYSLTNVEPSSHYDLQVATDSGFSNIEVDRSNIALPLNPGEMGTSLLYVNHPQGVGELEYNATYYWRVRVKGASGGWSDWLEFGSSFTTEPHPWPYAVFSWLPTNPAPEEKITFDATESETFVNPEVPAAPTYYCWRFPDGVYPVCFPDPDNPGEEICSVAVGGEPCCFTIPVIEHSVPTHLTQEIILRAIDANSKMGSRLHSLQPALPLPKWREVTPY